MLAEVCSAIPLSGSIYIWAAECGGAKYGRLIGFIVAFWVSQCHSSWNVRHLLTLVLCVRLVYYCLDLLLGKHQSGRNELRPLRG
jgi:hypothetical protein